MQFQVYNLIDNLQHRPQGIHTQVSQSRYNGQSLQTLVFLTSRVWVPSHVLKQDILPLLCVPMHAVGPVCCVTHVEEPSVLKIRGSPRCSWFDWQHIAPQHLLDQW